MDSQVVSNTPDANQPVRAEATFISGWFTKQFDAGKQPKYGYPTNHLPETTDKPMDMVTGFVTADSK
ncbi:hypothetical protein D3273_10685 [Lichenibacterium minor]|uniref:Uncharacterized protein n=1 Tax=Lichenibacterium minor TaxID=2316528 RepID=A0A4Q2U5P1_9HYPH|nr:hypothetical protein [Lichenibacterium minor]RYC31893.1 hypothetical protein D3273_10685 [Lichenibacterium minor]